MQKNYPKKMINKELIAEITEALKSVSPYGSLEVYVQNGKVTQITVRKIKKTKQIPATA